MPNPTIQLARQVGGYDDGNRRMYRLRYTASGGANDALLTDNKIFLYLALPAVGEAERVGVFQGVCSPADLADVPADDPEEEDEPPFARAATVDLLYRSSEALEFAQTTIESQVSILLEALLRLQTLGDSVTVTLTASGGS